MKEVFRYKVNEVAGSLCLSLRTVERYRRQFLNLGDIKPGGNWKTFEQCFYVSTHGISDNGSSADKTLATSRRKYDCELFLFFSFKTCKQIFTVEVEVMLVVTNLTF